MILASGHNCRYKIGTSNPPREYPISCGGFEMSGHRHIQMLKIVLWQKSNQQTYTSGDGQKTGLDAETV